jgi:hypothetical protein
VSYSENGMLKPLKNLDLSWQKTRPVHPKSDPRAQADFKKKFRNLIAETAAAHPEAERIEVWLQDEARIGQTGRNCRRWFQKGTRPTGIKDQRHTAVYLFGAVCPEHDAAFGLVLPIVSTDVMQAFLDQLSDQVTPGAHALLIMDRAGWHCANDLVMLDNITAVLLPPDSPESNAIERLWLYLDAGRIKSLCSMEWAQAVRN